MSETGWTLHCGMWVAEYLIALHDTARAGCSSGYVKKKENNLNIIE